MSDEDHSYHRMNAQARKAFRFLVSVVNIQAFDEASVASAAWFLPWDPLEDLMPFLAYTARAYILETISYADIFASENTSHLRQDEFDEVSKVYTKEICKELSVSGFVRSNMGTGTGCLDVTVHEPFTYNPQPCSGLCRLRHFRRSRQYRDSSPIQDLHP